MNDTVKVEVSLNIWQKNHQILISAKENVLELMNELENNKKLISEKKHNAIAEMYVREVRDINTLLDYSSENNGAPF